MHFSYVWLKPLRFNKFFIKLVSYLGFWTKSGFGGVGGLALAELCSNISLAFFTWDPLPPWIFWNIPEHPFSADAGSCWGPQLFSCGSILTAELEQDREDTTEDFIESPSFSTSLFLDASSFCAKLHWSLLSLPIGCNALPWLSCSSSELSLSFYQVWSVLHLLGLLFHYLWTAY